MVHLVFGIIDPASMVQSRKLSYWILEIFTSSSLD